MLAEQRVERQLEAEATAPQVERRVGVLFVHGVGSQVESATVREFGEPLERWLAAWHRNERVSGYGVLWSRLSYGEHPDGPARFALAIPADAGRPAETWVVAEAWWAARLEAPGLRTMVLWSGSIFLKFLGRLWYQATQRADPARGPLASRVVERLNALALLAGYALAALVGYPLLGALFLLAQIPLPQVEEFVLVRLLRPLLVDNLGDFYVYVTDEIQSRHIRRSVLEAIRWLVDEERCEHVVVVGHSQGAVVAYDALASAPPTAVDGVRALVTVGGALNDAWDFAPGRLGCELPPAIRWVNVWATYDPVSHGPFAGRCPRPPQEYPVTNGMNVVTDHGAYLRNPEEFVSFLAQLAERPADHTRSRFWSGRAATLAWVRRRRIRVVTSVTWRLAAIYAFTLGIVSRGALLVDDGRALWTWIEKAPGVGGLVAAGQRATLALRDLLLPPYGAEVWLAVAALAYLAALALLFGRTRRPVALLPPASAGLVAALFVLRPALFALAAGTAAWALAATAAYAVVSGLVFDEWDEDEGGSSARRAPPGALPAREILLRSAAVLVGVVAIAFAVAAAGPLPAAG